MVELIGSHQSVVDFSHYIRDTICRVQTLVGIGLTGVVGIGRDLPAAQINGFESCLDLLNGLIAGKRARAGT